MRRAVARTFTLTDLQVVGVLLAIGGLVAAAVVFLWRYQGAP